MKNIFLLPQKSVWVGWVLVGLGLVTGIMYLQDSYLSIFNAPQPPEGASFFERTTYQWSFALTCLIAGLYILGFSRKKIEDEFIEFTRYQSLIVSILIQSVALVVCSWLIGGIAFITVMMYNLIALLFVYNIVFVLLYFRNQRRVSE